MKHIFLFLAFLFSFTSFSQENNFFDDYKRMISFGPIPKAFTTSTVDKISEKEASEHLEMSGKDKKEFIQSVNYSIDELLQSGMIVFGDETSKYVQDVANKLLANHPDLLNELQFFVMKSNITNAMSTDQGIVFVTLGLLSQVENEAQLAYVLAHEITHYTQKHMQRGFEEGKHARYRSYDEMVTDMSARSREKENEADVIGVKLFHEAGYSKDDITGVFNVLMYCYLPFDEVKLPKDYFNNEYMYIPEDFFPTDINPIKAEADYDDSKSTHPNIKHRKDSTNKLIAQYKNWGDKHYFFSKERFKHVQTIARFEGLRVDLINHQYASVLYNVFLLEKEFPNSRFLSKAKANAWLGLSQSKIFGDFKKALTDPNKIEGESYAMYYLLKEFSPEQMITVGLRIIEDQVKRFPNDTEILAIKMQMIDLMVQSGKFIPENYKTITYLEAKANSESSGPKNKKKIVKKETKFEKIQNKTNISNEGFSPNNFYKYAISDLMKDEEFLRLFNHEVNRLNAMPHDSIMKFDPIVLKDVILIEPHFVSYKGQQMLVEKSKEIEEEITREIGAYCNDNKINVYDYTNTAISTMTTEQFNEKAMLIDFVNQRFSTGYQNIFPVDFLELNRFTKAHNNAELLFIYGVHLKKPVNTSAIALSVIVPFIGLPVLVSGAMRKNAIDYNAFVIDPETGSFKNRVEYKVNAKPKNNFLGTLTESALHQIQGKKK